MARSGIFQALRRRGAVLCAVLAYALLLNALLAAVFNVQAIAAALDPLSVAATCDSSGSNPSRDPARHNSQHQPDCTLCSPACPMGGMVQVLGGTVAVVATPPACRGLDIRAQRDSSIPVRSVYVSDTSAQAPPAIG
jgi:hypothetical protein